MGCVASKKAVAVTPAYDASGSVSAVASSGDVALASAGSTALWNRPPPRVAECFEFPDAAQSESGESGKASSGRPASAGTRLGNLHRYIEGEQVAAGWPAWLSAVAAEAIHGWVPLKADNFEKLEKIGQGTYSSVFRGREVETGRAVALKKVRFDSLEPESVRFMAREVLLLRRLAGHPNVVRLHGLIASRASPGVYLVFEYLHHDLAGLAASPDVPAFAEPQVKCLMRQLLAGLQHCHARGVMHRDVKCANLLVSADGVLKVADFGLANSFPAPGHPMTSRVVTLWYRPPELLLGATAYDASVDLWSAGCVFAELYTRKPILQGRTEVEQIHKIFKLCGSPAEEYWQKARVSHAAAFKPQHPYDTHLKDTFGFLPEPAFALLSTLLSVEPSKRGTASAALASEYFKTKPYACEPSSMPEYAPNKEMDVKFRARRRSIGRNHSIEASKKLSRPQKSLQEPNGTNHRHVHAEEALPRDEDGASIEQKDRRGAHGEARLLVDLQPVPAINRRADDRCSKQIAQGDLRFSGPLKLSASTGFAWAKKPKQELSCSKSGTRKKVPAAAASKPYEMEKQEMIKQWAQVADAFDTSEALQDDKILSYKGKGEMVEFSGPLLPQSRRVDELLQKHERQIRQAACRRSWFQRGSKRAQ